MGDEESGARFTHLDAGGAARMVDVSEKPVTWRVAEARGRVSMRRDTVRLVQEDRGPKGDVLGTARIAGIMAAKRTAELIPLCHSLPLSAVELDLSPDEASSCVVIAARVRTEARTGVEMEALTAVAVAALTVYDMCKAVDREMTVENIRLTYKSGGRSGTFERP